MGSMSACRQGQGMGTWQCCKVFCALSVTVNTCVLRATTKEGRLFFHSEKVPPPGIKILRVPTMARGKCTGGEISYTFSVDPMNGCFHRSVGAQCN